MAAVYWCSALLSMKQKWLLPIRERMLNKLIEKDLCLKFETTYSIIKFNLVHEMLMGYTSSGIKTYLVKYHKLSNSAKVYDLSLNTYV
jgi:hypothetical protein